MWILVADSSRARIFDASRAFQAPGDFTFERFEEVADLAGPWARAQNLEIDTDRPGRRSDKTAKAPNSGQRSAVGQRYEPKEFEARAFARRVSKHLDEAAGRELFDELVVVAGPAFLGMLREAMPARVAGRCVDEVRKDFSWLASHEIRARLPELIR